MTGGEHHEQPVGDDVRVLFATAEYSPLARVGGMALATAGLVDALRRAGTEVTIIVPDYGDMTVENETSWELDVPAFCGPTRARRGTVEGVDDVILIDRPGMARPHPYVEPTTGRGWPDNDERFMAFSAAIAAVTQDLQPDILHLNDWHTAATVGFLAERPPTVLTVHTLGYQGVCDSGWMQAIPHDSWRFAWYDGCNPLLGAIRSVDAIVAVSPNYVREILTPEQGMGLHEELKRRENRLVGIRNGIDTNQWDPSIDPHLPLPYTVETMEQGRAAARAQLLETCGWEHDTSDRLLGVVTRLVDQKGIDTIMGLAPYLGDLPARIVLLGSGQAELVELVNRAAEQFPDRIHAVTDRYDEPLSHLVFAGTDLFLMPSRFEPCGLAQMQAMAYGTLPVATPVGGLVDTIIDVDAESGRGTGFLATTNDELGFLDAVHRGVRAHKIASRRRSAQRRGMQTDWSWEQPAWNQIGLYRSLMARAGWS